MTQSLGMKAAPFPIYESFCHLHEHSVLKEIPFREFTLRKVEQGRQPAREFTQSEHAKDSVGQCASSLGLACRGCDDGRLHLGGRGDCRRGATTTSSLEVCSLRIQLQGDRRTEVCSTAKQGHSDPGLRWVAFQRKCFLLHDKASPGLLGGLPELAWASCLTPLALL